MIKVLFICHGMINTHKEWGISSLTTLPQTFGESSQVAKGTPFEI